MSIGTVFINNRTLAVCLPLEVRLPECGRMTRRTQPLLDREQHGLAVDGFLSRLPGSVGVALVRVIF